VQIKDAQQASLLPWSQFPCLVRGEETAVAAG